MFPSAFVVAPPSLDLFYDGEATHAMLAEPVVCGDCNEAHHWMVNRLGSTRCILCDIAKRQGEEKRRRAESVNSVREAFRLFRANTGGAADAR